MDPPSDIHGHMLDQVQEGGICKPSIVADILSQGQFQKFGNALKCQLIFGRDGPSLWHLWTESWSGSRGKYLQTLYDHWHFKSRLELNFWQRLEYPADIWQWWTISLVFKDTALVRAKREAFGARSFLYRSSSSVYNMICFGIFLSSYRVIARHLGTSVLETQTWGRTGIACSGADSPLS